MKPSNDSPARSQPDKFRDLARQLECDEDEKAFEDKVRKVANSSVKQPPKTSSDS